MCQPYIENAIALSDYYYYEFISETTVFGGRQKLTSAMKQRSEK